MTDDQMLIELIRASADEGPDLVADPQVVRRLGRARRTRRRLIGCATVLMAAGIAAIAAATIAVPNRSNPPLASPTSTSQPGRGAPMRAGPPCGDIPFDVTPTGGNYNESGTITTVDRNQSTTIVLTVRVTAQVPVHVAQLLLLIGPSSLGTDPFPAKVQVSLFSGQPRDRQRLPATFRLDTPGRYPRLGLRRINSHLSHC